MQQNDRLIQQHQTNKQHHKQKRIAPFVACQYAHQPNVILEIIGAVQIKVIITTILFSIRNCVRSRRNSVLAVTWLLRSIGCQCRDITTIDNNKQQQTIKRSTQIDTLLLPTSSIRFWSFGIDDQNQVW